MWKPREEVLVTMKIIAFYLPQYYAFPENDRWWGKGFTEWTNVKKSKPLYKGHYQPTVPLNENYYCLEDINVMKWQVDIAKEYGISGFCFYHYWFGDGRRLMEMPVENYLNHSEIDFPYCLCWANHNWSRTWVGGDQDILMDMKYGNKDEWEEHFEYLVQFFKDDRYIKIDDKPVLVIYQPQNIDCKVSLLAYLKMRAKEEGFKGLTIISQHMFDENSNSLEQLIDYRIQYQPNYIMSSAWKNKIQTLRYSPSFFLDLVLYRCKGIIKKLSKGKICKYRTYNYDCAWRYLINSVKSEKQWIAGAFVNCDVTPRRQERANIFKGATPKKFARYMKQLVRKVKAQDNIQIIFLSAWNEWGEGMYLEPDEKHGYDYLKGVKDAIS